MRIEGATLKLEAETLSDKILLDRLAKAKIHYYPESNSIVIF